jgi:hypothetical protein
VPMEVYADESGIHNGSKRCVLAGYAGGRRKLLELEKKWDSVLKEFGIPSDVGFHAKTFFKTGRDGKKFGVYSGWSESKAEDFLDEIVNAIRNSQVNPVAGAIDIEYFNSLSYNLRRWLTGGLYDENRRTWIKSGAPTKPYFFPFYQIIIGGATYAKDGVQVDYIFDRQDNFKKHALNLWNVMKDELNWRTGRHLGVISFASRLERIVLQAADLLAFCIYNKEEYSEHTKNVPLAFALHYLVADKEHVKSLNREAINLLTPGYPRSLRDADEKQSRIRELRFDNATADERVAHRNANKTTSGKGSETKEKAEG